MKLTEAKQQFIRSWGAFGTHWGINRTMAQIHALLLITPDPMTQDDIMEELNISRGNTNMNIRELINWLLRDTPNWSREQIDAVFRSGQRMDAKLAVPVPLFWVYVTAWATEEGVVHFRNDIYGYDGLDQFAQQTETPGQPATLGQPAPAPAN